MKRYLLEIVRQKWPLLCAILVLVLFNVILTVMVSSYQLPLLNELQTKWSNLRQQAAQSGQQDPAALYQQGTTDLAKLKTKIPEKRQFARVLSDLIEAAANSAVKIGTINYKPVPINEEALLSYQLSLSVNGGYAAVKSFLADLQKNPELIVVDTVSFSNNDLLVENVTMSLNITVYLREGV